MRRPTHIVAIALLGTVVGCAGEQPDSSGEVVEVVARGLTFEASHRAGRGPTRACWGPRCSW